MKKLIYLPFLLLFCNVSFAGGPWTKKQGKVFFKLSEWWTIFDQHYTDTGSLDPNVTTGIFNTSIYLEYGITDRFTGVINAPIFSRNYMNNLRSSTTTEIIVPGEAINGLGDIELVAKYSLTKVGAKFPIAISAGVGIPTGITSGGTFENLQTGDGEFNRLFQVDVGTGFQLTPKIPAYFSAYLGANNRTNGFSDEFRYGLELGLGLINQKLWINSKLNAVESFKNGDTAATSTSTSIFANNTEFISIALEANYYITDKFGISASMAGAFRGEIIAAAPSYSVGVFFDLK